jgi:hypothetical protein
MKPELLEDEELLDELSAALDDEVPAKLEAEPEPLEPEPDEPEPDEPLPAVTSSPTAPEIDATVPAVGA